MDYIKNMFVYVRICFAEYIACKALTRSLDPITVYKMYILYRLICSSVYIYIYIYVCSLSQFTYIYI